MEYKKTKDKIEVFGKDEFNSKHILECGQIFRYRLQSDGSYVVLSGDKKAQVFEIENGYQILSKDVDYFENFFDLKADYGKIKNQLLPFGDALKNATQYGYGIRILNQQPFEVIIGFIISANNNIKRIQSLVEKLSQKCGKNMGDYYAFPTPSELSTLSVEDLKALGMGFRAKYIFSTTQKLKDVNLDSLRNLSAEDLIEYLQKLDGVGPKVADCIALFAFHNMGCFPVDTWVEKIYNSFFAETPEKNRVKIHQNLIEKFGNLSGYAQQYLFYYKRELDKA